MVIGHSESKAARKQDKILPIVEIFQTFENLPSFFFKWSLLITDLDGEKMPSELMLGDKFFNNLMIIIFIFSEILRTISDEQNIENSS